KYAAVADLNSVIDSLNINHEKRMETSPEYRNLLEDIAYLKEREGETSVTLQEEKLKAERAKNEERSKARRDARRASLGMPAATGEDGDDESKSDNVDFIEDESLKIIADMINFTSENLVKENLIKEKGAVPKRQLLYY